MILSPPSRALASACNPTLAPTYPSKCVLHEWPCKPLCPKCTGHPGLYPATIRAVFSHNPAYPVLSALQMGQVTTPPLPPFSLPAGETTCLPCPSLPPSLHWTSPVQCLLGRLHSHSAHGQEGKSVINSEGEVCVYWGVGVVEKSNNGSKTWEWGGTQGPIPQKPEVPN